MQKEPYICTDCKSTFTIDFHRCPECVKGYIYYVKQKRQIGVVQKCLSPIGINQVTMN